MGLKQPKKERRRGLYWCGPFAIALLAGVSYDKAMDTAIRCVNNRAEKGDYNTVEGMSLMDLCVAAERLGVRVNWRDLWPWRRPTVSDFVARNSRPGRALLIGTRDHFLTVYDGKLYDNHGRPRPLEVARYRKAKVYNFAHVRPRPGALTA